MKTMMSDGIYTRQIGDRIRAHFINSKESIIIISPFINSKLIVSMAEKKVTNKIVIVTSWRPDYLVLGYSDLSLYQICKAHRWELRINNQIHAKMYLFDNEVLSLGSANFTGAGFGINANSNLEAMIDIIPSVTELALVSKIISSSILVDDALYEKVFSWLKTQPSIKKQNIQGYLLVEDGNSIESLPRSVSPEAMWDSVAGCSDDLGAEEIASIDATRFGLFNDDSYEAFVKSMKVKFDLIPAVQDFLCYINKSENGRRFGECRSWVRKHYSGSDYDMCTELTQVLFSWIPELYKQYRVWRPNYTQVIYNIDLHRNPGD